MKHIFLLLILASFTKTIIAQSLFTIGNNSISTSEFLRAYNKNKPSTTNKQQSMREYLDLYINFKLKVKAAQEIRLDTLPQINYDVQNFRTQVVENYLNDDEGLQMLTNEAAERATKDIQLQYYFVPILPNSLPTDTVKAYAAINALYSLLKKSVSNPIEIVNEVTQKYSLAKYADAGFITVFTLPYAMENEVYQTAIGEVSKPFKNNKGWFIFKPVAQRVAMGKWKIAQLLFAFPPDADKKASLKAKADSVYTLLIKGLSFEEAAAKFSDDRTSATNAGVLQEFGAGTYSADFEKNIIALKNDGELSKPFETSFGYHIVKRISQKKIPTDKLDNGLLYDSKQLVMQDERIEKVKESFLKTITSKTNFKKVATITSAAFYEVADSVLKSKDGDKNKICLAFAKKSIVQFDKANIIRGSNWIEYVKSNTQLEGKSNKDFEKPLQDFYNQTITNFYKANIEKYNLEFKNQMQEFKDGNMLFEIMEQKVWSKAGQDSINLKKYYNSNIQKYKWAASADVIIFHANNITKANEALLDLKNGFTWNEIVQKSDNQIQADSGRYEITQIPGLAENAIIKTGTTSDVLKNPTEGDANFVYFIKTYDGNMQRNFTDAKGLVINDYQTVLEKQWIDELNKKYPVKINEAVFKDLVK